MRDPFRHYDDIRSRLNSIRVQLNPPSVLALTGFRRACRSLIYALVRRRDRLIVFSIALLRRAVRLVACRLAITRRSLGGSRPAIGPIYPTRKNHSAGQFACRSRTRTNPRRILAPGIPVPVAQANGCRDRGDRRCRGRFAWAASLRVKLLAVSLRYG